MATVRAEQERSRATRQAVLDAALDELGRVGWAGLSTRAVAAAAGVSRGALTHHYPSKVDLVIAAMDHGLARRLEAMLRAGAADTGEATRSLEEVADLLWRGVRGRATVVWFELIAAARVDPELRAELPRLADAFTAQLDELLGRLLGPDVWDALDPARRATASMVVFALLNGLALDDSVGINADRVALARAALADVLAGLVR